MPTTISWLMHLWHVKPWIDCKKPTQFENVDNENVDNENVDNENVDDENVDNQNVDTREMSSRSQVWKQNIYTNYSLNYLRKGGIINLGNQIWNLVDILSKHEWTRLFYSYSRISPHEF